MRKAGHLVLRYDEDITGQLTIWRVNNPGDDNETINIPIVQVYAFYRALTTALAQLREKFPMLPHYNGGMG